MSQSSSTIGVVVIGRNEGDRLRLCLESAVAARLPSVYVDSASIDDSVAIARDLGLEVVELNDDLPLTAARARNAGLDYLLSRHSELRLVQFLDGDCQLQDGWLVCGQDFLSQQRGVAVVCGRTRERSPTSSVYNRLCDMEWGRPIGQADACGGNAMVRVEAFRQVGGYDPCVIAAEDDELCLRLRQRGWRIHRLDSEMVLHDAAMRHFGQWWTRARRAGHCYAQLSSMHGRSAVAGIVRQSRSVWFWAGILPLLVVSLAVPTRGWILALLAGYPLLAWRVYRRMRRKGTPGYEASIYAGHCILAKFPQMIGQLTFHINRLRRRQSTIIEHKKPDPQGAHV